MLFLKPRRSLNVRRRVADFDGPAFFGHVVEESEHAVEIALREGIVFVVVAAGTAERQAEPDGGGRFDAVGDVLDGVFFGNDAAFGVAAVIAVETSSNSLLER